MDKLRFGIIGCGNIGARFAKALDCSEAAELYACAARDKQKAENFAKEQGAKIAYGDYQSLIEDENVEAIYIATVNTTHAEIAKDCINAGKAVICEKPFFTNAKEAEEVIALAKQKQVLVMEGFWTRCVPAYHKVKEWIADGKIGDVKLIRAAFCFAMPYNEKTKNFRHFDPKVGGGILLDTGVYTYEYVTGIMEAHPDEVQAMCEMGQTGVDVSAAMNLKYNSGTIAQCMASLVSPMDDTAFIGGSKGYIKQERFWGSRKCELYSSKGELVDSFEDPVEEGFIHEIAHFVETYRAGKTESELIPLADTLDFAKRVDDILGKEKTKSVSKFSLEELELQEKELRFEHFSAEDAEKLAGIMVELQKADGKAAAIRIDLNGLNVFRYMPEGTGKLQEIWLEKKCETVKMMGKSTLRVWTEMNARGIPRKWELMPSSDLVFCGGGFPILLADGTVLGAVAVSGPGDEYEHKFIVKGLRNMIKL